MKSIVCWSRRIGALLSAIIVGVLVPSAARAHTDAATSQPLAKGKAIAAVGGLSALCCLVVVAIIAGGVVMIVRRRRRQ